MKKLILIVVPLLVLVLGAGGAYAFLMPKKKATPPNLVGTVVSVPGAFTLNLAGNHYATLQLALLVPTLPKTGLADEPVIRAIVTNDLTDQPEDNLIDASGRAALAHRILEDINHQTDAVVTKVYFTDLAVQ